MDRNFDKWEFMNSPEGEEEFRASDLSDAEDNDTVSLYIKEIGPIELLSPDNEFRLATLIQAAKLLDTCTDNSPEKNIRAAIDGMEKNHLAFLECLNDFNAERAKRNKPVVPLPNYRELIAEAIQLSRQAQSADASPLYLYCSQASQSDEGEKRQWAEVTGYLFNAFLCVLLLPDSLQRHLETISQTTVNPKEIYPLLRENLFSHEEAETQLERVQDRAVAASQTFVSSNLKLVFSIAKRYQGRGTPLSDLIQEGNVGLFHAVSKFDPRLGYRFSTYATWWIRQAIIRSLAEKSRLIRIPTHTYESLMKISRARQNLEQELGRIPTPEELAIAVGMVSPKDAADWRYRNAHDLPMDRELNEKVRSAGMKVQELLRSMEDPISLETPADGDENSEPFFPEDENAPDPERETEKKELQDGMRSAMDLLTERERKILAYRFGLAGEEEKTLEEIGQEFGLTRERIRQIEASALRKLRHPKSRRLLEDYYE